MENKLNFEPTGIPEAGSSLDTQSKPTSRRAALRTLAGIVVAGALTACGENQPQPTAAPTATAGYKSFAAKGADFADPTPTLTTAPTTVDTTKAATTVVSTSSPSPTIEPTSLPSPTVLPTPGTNNNGLKEGFKFIEGSPITPAKAAELSKKPEYKGVLICIDGIGGIVNWVKAKGIEAVRGILGGAGYTNIEDLNKIIEKNEVPGVFVKERYPLRGVAPGAEYAYQTPRHALIYIPTGKNSFVYGLGLGNILFSDNRETNRAPLTCAGIYICGYEDQDDKGAFADSLSEPNPGNTPSTGTRQLISHTVNTPGDGVLVRQKLFLIDRKGNKGSLNDLTPDNTKLFGMKGHDFFVGKSEGYNEVSWNLPDRELDKKLQQLGLILVVVEEVVAPIGERLPHQAQEKRIGYTIFEEQRIPVNYPALVDDIIAGK